MDSVQIITNLLVERGIPASKMCKDLGFSSGLFTQWKQGKQKPSARKIESMAEYFHVSTDYLLGKEQQKKPTIVSDDGPIDPLDEQLTDLLRRATPEQKKAWIALLESMPPEK